MDAIQDTTRAGRNPRLATFLLASCMFATGACGLVFEYILSTVSTYILGNSIEQFSITIALMLFMMGVAGFLQRFLRDTRLVEKFVTVEVLIAVIGGFAPIALYASFALMQDHFRLVQYFTVSTVGFLIGFEIPLVLRINEHFSRSLGANIANIYGPDFIGAFVGSLVWTYVLLRRLPLTESSFVMAGVNLLIALVAFVYFARFGMVRAPLRYGLLLVIALGALVFGYHQNRNWDMKLEQRLYDDRIVMSTTTKYQRLVMTRNKILDEYRLYINGNLQFSSLDEAVYHELLVHPAMAVVPDHARMLILGGGDGMALREVLKYPDVREVTLVDIDPQMIAFAMDSKVLGKLNNNSFADARVTAGGAGGVSPGDLRAVFQETGKYENTFLPETVKVARVHVINIDADLFLSTVPGKYNVVIVDLPDPNSIELTKLYSREFYMKVSRVLSERGVLVVQSTSPYHAKEAFLCIKRTMESAGFETLPYHDNVPSFGDWGWLMAVKRAGRKPVLPRKADAVTSFSVPTRYLTPEVFQSARVFGKDMLETDDRDINTLMRPVLLNRYLYASWLTD